MVSSAAQGRFAAEFAAFLIATAGLAVVALRAELVSRLWWARSVLVVGFSAVGTAAFLQGSLLVSDPRSGAMVVVNAAGLALVLAGSIRWAGGATSQRLLWSGIALMAVSIPLLHAGNATAADLTLGPGAVIIGVSLLVASRRAVAARVAASAAGALLAVVLVLSIALSAVLSSTIQDDAGRRLDARGATETALVESAGSTNALLVARSASLVLSASAEAANELRALAANPRAQTSSVLSAFLATIRQNLFPQVSLFYAAQSGRILGFSQTGAIDQATLAGVIGSAPVQQVISHGTITRDAERGSVEVVGSVAVAVGVEPVGIIDAATQLVVYPGVLLALQPLDNAYLAVRTSTDPTVALALVSRTSVVAQAGASIPTATLLRLAGEALDSPTPLKARQVGDRFDSVKTVLASDNTPVMALVASTPTTEVTDVRDKLFRTLFIIALGGTLLALLLAAVVGERIGAGLRTLTDAAQRIQRGEFAQPSGVRAEDEVGVLGAAFDSMALSISEQTAALQRAAEDETALRNQLEAVVAGMGEALVAVDAAGHVTLVNRAAEELLGVVANDARGRPVGEVLVPSADDGRQLMARLQRATPARWSTVATIESVDGSIPVAVSAGALRAPGGGLAGVVYVLRDLRPERQVERMKSEFLSRIGHELRTPLTAILGYAEILLHRPVPEPKVRQFHEEIHEAGKRLSRIVEMLEFSAAAEAGRSLLRPEPTSIRSLVDAVVADWKDRVNGNHAIVRRVARGLPQIVADRRWLSMSINELVDNAVKFSPEGGKVGIAAEATSYQGRPAVEISVADQGVGMSEAERDRVFAEFIQGDASDTRRFGGLGLGLSMVRRVAEAHGGTVMCTSTPRKGSKFSIVVPA